GRPRPVRSCWRGASSRSTNSTVGTARGWDRPRRAIASRRAKLVRTIDEHRAAALALCAPGPVVAVPIAEARDLVLASYVRTDEPLPRWDCSAMDGFAVLARDLARASAERPVSLPLAGELPAGARASET